MRSREGDLFANFERVRREMDELFGGVLERGLHGRTHRSGFEPAVDVFCEQAEDGAQRVVVHAELAGIDPDHVALEIRGRELVLAGSRPAGEAEGRAYQQVEIGTGAFRRVVALGVEVHAGRARATYRDGILRVELPVRAADDPPSAEPGDAGDASAAGATAGTTGASAGASGDAGDAPSPAAPSERDPS